MRFSPRVYAFLTVMSLLGSGSMSGSIRAEQPLAGVRLTLEEARRRALADNPDLKAAAAAALEARGVLRGAKAPQDPELSVEAEDFGGDLPRWSQSQTTLSLTQALEFPGKRGAREDAALSRLRAAEQARLAAAGDLLASVERCFVELLAGQETLTLAEENAASAAEVRDAVAALVGAGEASPIEENRAKNEETLAQIDLSKARTLVASARIALARVMGLETPDFLGAEGDLASLGESVPPGVGEGATASSPVLEKARLDVAALASDLRAARRSLWPDLTLGVGWRRYAQTGEHAYVATVAIPLPLFGRSRGVAQEKAAALDRGSQEARAVQLRVSSELHTALEEYRGATEEAARIRKDLLPASKDVYEALGEGYRRGKFRLLDLLQARRDYAAARGRFVDALLRLNRARIELERLSGSAVHELGVSQP